MRRSGSASTRSAGQRQRRPPGAVIGDRLPARLDDHGEEVAADPRRHRLDHAEDGVGGDRRVDRRPAAIEDVERCPAAIGWPVAIMQSRPLIAGGGGVSVGYSRSLASADRNKRG